LVSKRVSWLDGGAWEVSSGIELRNLSSLEKQLRTD